MIKEYSERNLKIRLLFLLKIWLVQFLTKYVYLAAVITDPQANTKMFTTEAALNLQVAPTPATASAWPHWGWLLAIALMGLGIMGVVCCCRR